MSLEVDANAQLLADNQKDVKRSPNPKGSGVDVVRLGSENSGIALLYNWM